MELPENTFDITDQGTLVCVAFLYSGKHCQSESQLSKNRIRNFWYPVEIPRKIDPLTVVELCKKINGELIIFPAYGQSFGKYIAMKLDDKRVYFRDRDDATIAKMIFSTSK